MTSKSIIVGIGGDGLIVTLAWLLALTSMGSFALVMVGSSSSLAVVTSSGSGVSRVCERRAVKQKTPMGMESVTTGDGD